MPREGEKACLQAGGAAGETGMGCGGSVQRVQGSQGKYDEREREEETDTRTHREMEVHVLYGYVSRQHCRPQPKRTIHCHEEAIR